MNRLWLKLETCPSCVRFFSLRLCFLEDQGRRRIIRRRRGPYILRRWVITRTRIHCVSTNLTSMLPHRAVPGRSMAKLILLGFRVLTQELAAAPRVMHSTSTASCILANQGFPVALYVIDMGSKVPEEGDRTTFSFGRYDIAVKDSTRIVATEAW